MNSPSLSDAFGKYSVAGTRYREKDPDRSLPLPYLYIDRVLNELRDELLSAMHAALQAEMRNGRVDVPRLYRAFTRAAAKEMANPVLVSDKCLEQYTARPKKGAGPRTED